MEEIWVHERGFRHALSVYINANRLTVYMVYFFTQL